MNFKVTLTCLALLCLLFPSNLHAQSARQKIAQISKEINNAPDNKEKVELLIRASRELRKIAPRTALSYSQDAVNLANKLSYRQGMAYASVGARYINRGYINRENYRKAITAYKKALTYNTGDENQKSRAGNYESLGHSYNQLNDYTNAIKNYKEELALQKKLKNEVEIAVAHNKIGQVYFKQKNYKQALKSFEAALVLAKKLKNQEDINHLENNISLVKDLINKPAGTPPERAAPSNLQTLKMEAQEFQEKYEITLDSLVEARQMVQRAVDELQVKEDQLKQKEDSIKEKEDQILTLEQARAVLAEEKALQERLNQLIVLGSGAAMLVMIIIALLIYSQYRSKKRSNKALEAAKRKSDDLLLNILPEKIAVELKDKGKVQPAVYPNVTMLFTDFKGFTKIAAQLPPEKLIQELEYCFEAFDEICDRHNLEKIKTIGDAYMAAGGIPVKNSTHTRDAVSAALEMQAFMWKWKQEKKAKGEPFWELRIGIHTGSVIAGVIGKYEIDMHEEMLDRKRNKKFTFDIWGDDVNIASRMESSGEEWKVNISQTTYNRVKKEFVCLHRGKIPIKHKGPVDMYFVQNQL